MSNIIQKMLLMGFIYFNKTISGEPANLASLYSNYAQAFMHISGEPLLPSGDSSLPDNVEKAKEFCQKVLTDVIAALPYSCYEEAFILNADQMIFNLNIFMRHMPALGNIDKLEQLVKALNSGQAFLDAMKQKYVEMLASIRRPEIPQCISIGEDGMPYMDHTKIMIHSNLRDLTQYAVDLVFSFFHTVTPEERYQIIGNAWIKELPESEYIDCFKLMDPRQSYATNALDIRYINEQYWHWQEPHARRIFLFIHNLHLPLSEGVIKDLQQLIAAVTEEKLNQVLIFKIIKQKRTFEYFFAQILSTQDRSISLKQAQLFIQISRFTHEGKTLSSLILKMLFRALAIVPPLQAIELIKKTKDDETTYQPLKLFKYVDQISEKCLTNALTSEDEQRLSDRLAKTLDILPSLISTTKPEGR